MSSDGSAAPPALVDEVPSSLDELRNRIHSLAESVKSLKSASSPDKDAISAAVSALLDAKRSYSVANDGIDVDGKPWEEPMSKAEKKRMEKEAKKRAAAAESGGGGDANDANLAKNEDNAAKKAAKKAEAKAKKAAAKSGDGKAAAAPSGSGGAPVAPSSAATKATASRPVSSSASAAAAAAPAAPSSVIGLRPNQISFNPNSPLSERPVVALTAAILANVIVDYDLVSDHNRRVCALGLPGGGNRPNGATEIAGDLAMARYVARSVGGRRGMTDFLGGPSIEGRALVDQYVDYASSLSRFGSSARGGGGGGRARAVRRTLDPVLRVGTYLLGHSMTLADVAVFAALGFPSSDEARAEIASMMMHPSSEPPSQSVAIREATQLAIGIAGKDEARLEGGASLEPMMPGMNHLEGATPGNVSVRFPPEPSGYLHVGHAKAVLLSDYYARRYRGRLILRFDDTNPTKEKDEYQSSIVEDLAKIGVRPDVVTFTSDYFGTIEKWALWMIKNGIAYMDDTPQEQMQKERMDRQNSRHRDQSPSEALGFFKLMCSGSEEGSVWCLRAKIDMTSDNGTLRDPVLYRQNLTPHHRSGTTYKAYPTYDLACPIVDSIEGVTHALRTTEYDDRNAQFAWIQRALGLRRVRIQTFARMNFMYTVMSKRKLTWFVETGKVTGWDDPRFPTVRGVTRRGIDVGALKRFMCSQGASRRVVNMEWSKFWAENKKEIDKYAKRFMAIDKNEHVALTVTNAGDGVGFLTTDYLPKDPSFGKRLVRISKTVLLEKVDTDGMEVGESIVLTRWGVVELTKIEGGLEGIFIPGGDVKSAKRKLSWLADVPENIPTVLMEFDNLISKEKLEEDDKFEDFINPNTQAETEVIGDAGLKTLKENDIIQLERRGYYRVDRPYINEAKPLILFMIPDGKKKAMSGLDGKLAHH
ncbi:hypothetical protein ACHAW5_005482 [Stephanodiscus triporus]|uniref:glutamate--tRNA ligase n=1 Tax=Stephanodiscus triporus TaxID=2934178 RepID=A0ABD3PQ44_9STRA